MLLIRGVSTHHAGVGFLGQATILIAQYKPLRLFTVVRHINLEALTAEQLEEVQQEMKLSQQLSHHNVACYLTSFVVGVHLWAVQPLMHYGKLCVRACVCVVVTPSQSDGSNGNEGQSATESVLHLVQKDQFSNSLCTSLISTTKMILLMAYLNLSGSSHDVCIHIMMCVYM